MANNVENRCKNLWNTQCKNNANLCVKIKIHKNTCITNTFSQHFSHLSHLLLHHLFTPVSQLFFPLFHIPYYNYNYININSN